MYTPAGQERLIAFHRARGMKLIQKARARRKWLRSLEVHNPGASAFYPERLDLLRMDLGVARGAVRRARAKLAELTAEDRRVAA